MTKELGGRARTLPNMGCAPSREEPGAKEAVSQNSKIDKQLRIDKKNDDRTVKILLLGGSLLQ